MRLSTTQLLVDHRNRNRPTTTCCHKTFYIALRCQKDMLSPGTWIENLSRQQHTDLEVKAEFEFTTVGAIPTPWHFFTYICCKNCDVCLKRRKIKRKRTQGRAFYGNNLKIVLIKFYTLIGLKAVNGLECSHLFPPLWPLKPRRDKVWDW